MPNQSQELVARLSFTTDELNAEFTAWKRAHESWIEHACNVGRMLCEAKDRLLHGQWTGWLAENFLGSADIAQRAMQVYGVHEHHPDLLQDAEGQMPTSMRGALAAINRNRQERSQGARDALNRAAGQDDAARRRKLMGAFERAALHSHDTLTMLDELVEVIADDEPQRRVLAGIADACAKDWQNAKAALLAGEQLQVS